MKGSYPNSLHLWKETPSTTVEDLFGPPGNDWIKVVDSLGEWSFAANEMAQKLYACEALKPRPKSKTAVEDEPYTLQWFLDIENQRHGRQARWIPRLLEFTKHAGETLLGFGHGLGTDWIQYARNGASVIVCSACQAQLELIRRNFQLRSLEGRFVHASPECLPLKNGSIDVACINGLLQQVDDPQAVVAEVFRVLKPGGKVIAVTPAKYDVDYWKDWVFFWQRFAGKRRRKDEEGQRRFTVHRLRRLFGNFEEQRVKKRQLRRSEVPHLWRLLPVSLLQRLIGRVLVIKAFKPVSTALPMKMAA